jgi:hypothetical protein
MTDKSVDRMTYLQSLKSLLTNRNFVLLLHSYGINIGVFYAVSTLLNQIVLLHFDVSSAAMKLAETINDTRGCKEGNERCEKAKTELELGRNVLLDELQSNGLDKKVHCPAQ